MRLTKRQQILLILLVIILAGIFRLWQLPMTPPGLYPDEAMNGNDAVQTLASGQFKVFYPENNGREGLYIWLLALSFKIFGASVWSLRLVSAILGTLSVLGLYLLTKEIFQRGKAKAAGSIALLSAFFMAVSAWHINFSRIGFRAVLMVLLICFAFYFLLRGFRKKSALNHILAGVFFGLGFYSYLAFRLAVLLLAAVVLIEAAVCWQKNRAKNLNWRQFLKTAFFRQGWWKIGLFCLTLLIVILPLALHFLNNPEHLISRTGGISVFAAENPLKEFGLSALKTIGMFHIAGDWNWRHNLSGSPLLARSVGILFILGFILGFKSIFSPGKNWLSRSGAVFLLSWFVIMLLPAVLTREGLPHALRSIGIIPVVCIYSALGLSWIFNRFSRLDKKLAGLILIFFILHPIFANYHKYFVDWANHPYVSAAFRQDLVNLTHHLNQLPPKVTKYLIINESGVPIPYPDGPPAPVQTIKFISQSQINYLKPDQLGQIQAGPGQSAVIVPLKNQPELDQILKNKWPNLKIIKINGFNMYEIK